MFKLLLKGLYMLVNCDTCQKKFLVPDSAITASGRLLQCGSCGNKWTQYPIKQKIEEKIKKVTPVKTKLPSNTNKKKSSIKKKREINLYSKEYLKKKHGLTIKDTSDFQDNNKKEHRNNFGFYGYLLTTSIFIITLFGILHLSEDIIVTNFPDIEPYINILYEALDIARITFSKFLN